MTQTILLAPLEGSAPERMVSAELALLRVRTARTIEPKAQPAASASSVYSQCRTRETSTRWTTCAVTQCTESRVLCGMRKGRGTLINAGDLL